MYLIAVTPFSDSGGVGASAPGFAPMCELTQSAEILAKTVKPSLDDLVDAEHVTHQGERRWRRYRLSSQEHKGHGVGENLWT